MEFKVFIEQEEKGWKARRKEILALWRSIQPGLPLQIDPIPATHQGSRYDRDGIRITGNAGFINTLLSRLKDLLQYEINPSTKLDVSYEQIVNQNSNSQNPRFVCYIHVVQRETAPVSSNG